LFSIPETDLLFLLSGSASPPPLEAASLPRGMVTMRCDISTCSSSHVSLLVSGSAQTCFDDQVHIWYSSNLGHVLFILLQCNMVLICPFSF
jgi:hypothetical protein